MVWYLSKAAGAPCPFARAGIRLCDYGENGKKGSEVNPGKERKRERDRLRRAEQCGQKRKRLLRSCADRRSDTESDSSDDEQPQCKRPLTLRLPPLQSLSEPKSRSPSPAEVIDLSNNTDSDSEDESMSEDSSSSSDEDEDDEENQEDYSGPVDDAWHQPPYPRASEALSSSIDDPPSNTHATRDESVEAPEGYWRSLSAPYSTASSPPESEDEDYDMALDDDVYSSSGHWDSDDIFADIEFTETETQWDSPGPMSPPSQFHDEDVVVKQEPRDVQGLLDSWEGLGNRVLDIVQQAAAGTYTPEEPKVKKEEDFALHELLREITGPGYDYDVESPEDERALFIKEEEDEDAFSFRDRFSSSPSMSPMTPFTPFSPSTSYFRYVPISTFVESRRDSEHSWADADLFSPHDVKPHDLDNGIYQEAEVKRERSLSKEPVMQAPHDETAPGSPSVSPPEEAPAPARVLEAAPPPPAREPFTLPESSHGSSASTATPSRHIQETSESSQTSERDEVVVVDTLTPCVPAIWATTFEGM